MNVCVEREREEQLTCKASPPPGAGGCICAAACQKKTLARVRTSTQTQPEKHVQPRRRARRERCASASSVHRHSKRSNRTCPLPAATGALLLTVAFCTPIHRSLHGPGRGPSPDRLDRARGSLQRRSRRLTPDARPRLLAGPTQLTSWRVRPN